MLRNSLLRLRIGIAPWKRLLLIVSVFLFLACVGHTHRAYANDGDADQRDDVNYLDQYGTWIDVQPYGNVWQPSVRSDWRPFEYGHWVWTDGGWAWVTYEPYGWLVFHYGNWDFRPDVGWFWIEGSDWSPARVVWRTYDGYSSWAPMPPEGVEWQEPWHQDGLRFWVVVRDRDLDRENIGHYRISRPPVPRERDGRGVTHEPMGVHDFEKIAGRTVTPEPLRHDDPAPVYMHPKHGEIQHDQRPIEQTPPQNRPIEPHQVDNKPPVTHPVQVQTPENRPAGNQTLHFHKMVLPQSEQAKVQKYSAQVEKQVLVPKKNHKQPTVKVTKTKTK